jgi:dihydrofolate reductase
MGVVIMRQLTALVFNYSLDGLLADPDTDFWKFCFELLDQHGGPDDDEQTLELLDGAYAHLMGRVAYEGMSEALPASTDNPWSDILNRGRKVVFSRTLTEPAWINTTVAAGETAEEVDKLRSGGDGHIIVWGGVTLWRSLMNLDLIDEWRVSMYPYVTGKGTRLFDDVPAGYRLDLVSSVPNEQGILELHYRRHR